MGKKFCILEITVDRYDDYNGLNTCRPADKDMAKPGYQEVLYLHPSRIIDGSRLRYGTPEEGDTYFTEDGGGELITCIAKVIDRTRLILDPAKPEQTDLDRVLDQAPSCIGSEAKAWVRDSLIPFLRKE